MLGRMDDCNLGPKFKFNSAFGFLAGENCDCRASRISRRFSLHSLALALARIPLHSLSHCLHRCACNDVMSRAD